MLILIRKDNKREIENKLINLFKFWGKWNKILDNLF